MMPACDSTRASRRGSPSWRSRIRQDYGAGRPIHLVAVLKGAFMFLADLMRAMDGPVTCDFIAVSSYGSGTTSSGEVRLTRTSIAASRAATSSSSRTSSTPG